MPAPTSSISAWAIRICRRPPHVLEKLKETLGKPRTDRYSASRGIPGLRKAQAAYYARRFGVKLNPETQIVATLGSKEGFANVAQAITAPGDVVLCPNPSYPIHAFGFLMAGGVIRSVPSEPTPQFFEAAGARDHPFDPEADRAGGLLSLQSDRLCRRPRLLQGPGRVREEARDLHPVRSRLCRSLFRRQESAALGAAGSRRDRRHRRVHLDVEDVLDGGLAHGLCGRQRADHRGAGAGEILSRLRRVHAGAGRGDRRAERAAGVHPGDARHLPQAPRCAGRIVRPRRLGHSAAGGLDVRLGAAAEGVRARSAACSSQP